MDRFCKKRGIQTSGRSQQSIFTLNSISDFYTQTEPDSAFAYAQQALALAEELNFDKGKFWAIVSTNKALYMLGNYALQLSFAFKAYPPGQKLNDLHARGWSLGMLGDCYFNLGAYSTALDYYRQVKQSTPQGKYILWSLNALCSFTTKQ
jgi:tetratricopeptide (TPR) repeat protein